MTTPTVTELTRPLEPIGHDTFADEAERAAVSASRSATHVPSTSHARVGRVAAAPALARFTARPQVGARAA